VHRVQDGDEARAHIDLSNGLTIDCQLQAFVTGKVLVAVLTSAVDSAASIEIKTGSVTVVVATEEATVCPVFQGEAFEESVQLKHLIPKVVLLREMDQQACDAKEHQRRSDAFER
jgi:hypothetical protein